MAGEAGNDRVQSDFSASRRAEDIDGDGVVSGVVVRNCKRWKGLSEEVKRTKEFDINTLHLLYGAGRQYHRYAFMTAASAQLYYIQGLLTGSCLSFDGGSLAACSDSSLVLELLALRVLRELSARLRLLNNSLLPLTSPYCGNPSLRSISPSSTSPVPGPDPARLAPLELVASR